MNQTDKMKDLSTIIANRYISDLKGGSKKSLTDTIVDSAKNMQITNKNLLRNIVQLVNRKVNDFFYTISPNKFYTFKLANPDEVVKLAAVESSIDLSNIKTPEVGVAKTIDKVLKDGDLKKTASDYEFKNFIFESNAAHIKTASGDISLDRKISIAHRYQQAEEQIKQKQATATYELYMNIKQAEDYIHEALSEGVPLTDVINAIHTIVPFEGVQRDLVKEAMDYTTSYLILTPAELEKALDEKLAEDVEFNKEDNLISTLYKIAEGEIPKPTVPKPKGFMAKAGKMGSVGMNAGMGILFAPKVNDLAVTDFSHMNKLNPVKGGH